MADYRKNRLFGILNWKMCWPWRRHEAAMPPVLRFLYFNYENNYKTVCELSTAFCYFLHHNPLLKMPFWSSALQYSSRFCRSQASNIFRLVCVEFCFFSARLSLFLVFGWLHSLVQSQYRSCPRQVCLVSSSQSNFFGLCCWMRRCSHVTPSSEQLLRRLAEAGRLGICRYTGYGCGAGRSAAQERGPGTPNTP